MSNTQKIGVSILQERLKTVSERSGVYRMIDVNGTVMYVGKAKNLKKRLTNYTRLDGLSIRIRQMGQSDRLHIPLSWRKGYCLQQTCRQPL